MRHCANQAAARLELLVATMSPNHSVEQSDEKFEHIDQRRSGNMCAECEAEVRLVGKQRARFAKYRLLGVWRLQIANPIVGWITGPVFPMLDSDGLQSKTEDLHLLVDGGDLARLARFI